MEQAGADSVDPGQRPGSGEAWLPSSG